MRCLTGLNLHWYKSYNQNAKIQKIKARLTDQSLKLINGHFTTISGHFFANYVNIFYKSGIQTVILRCLMSLKCNWCKNYDTKCKNAENANESFFTKSQKNGNRKICFLCHNFCTNKDLELLSTSK